MTPPRHLRRADAASQIANLVKRRREQGSASVFVAIDGRSGAGKSTFADEIAVAAGGMIVEGDDFYSGGIEFAVDDPASRAARCIDWRRQRDLLETLRAGRAAIYHAFDWDEFDGRLCEEATQVDPGPVLFLEVVYSARPELADLLDIRVLLQVPDEVRLERLLAREGSIGAWERQWHEAEDWYFQHVAREREFDVVVGE